MVILLFVVNNLHLDVFEEVNEEAFNMPVICQLIDDVFGLNTELIILSHYKRIEQLIHTLLEIVCRLSEHFEFI